MRLRRLGAYGSGSAGPRKRHLPAQSRAVLERLIEKRARIEPLGQLEPQREVPIWRLTFVSCGKLSPTVRVMRTTFSSSVRHMRRRCAS